MYIFIIVLWALLDRGKFIPKKSDGLSVNLGLGCDYQCYAFFYFL